MKFMKQRGKKLLAASGLVAVAVAGFAAIAMAAPHNPKGEFAQFSDCPLNTATITDCVYSVSTKGTTVLGKKTVPIVNPITFQGGFEGGGSSIKFYGAEDGNTLSKSPQPVPGGLAGLVNCNEISNAILKASCKATFENGLTGVNATVELAGPTKGYLPNVKLNTENLLFEEGVALQLPVKIHLENPFLGSTCYVGTDSKPIFIPFTTGATNPPAPNKSIHGSAGTFSSNADFTLLTFSGNKLVENAWAAPAASGCGGFLVEYLLNPIINASVGLPSPAGKNTAILEGTLKDAASSAVRASEK